MKKKHLLILTVAALFVFTKADAQTPPATWQEHWFEHNQLLSRVYYDNDLALYYDNDVNTSITWPRQFLGDVWRYTKKMYGSFGTDPHMFAILHTGKYYGGHPSTYFDASHDYRNTIDLGSNTAWSGSDWDYGASVHEVGHIVEIGGKNVHSSPAFGIWKDSKWAEIYIYDVYLGLGLTSRATAAFNSYNSGSDSYPRAGTFWFRDWFYPIYRDYGGTQVLNKFFVQLALYFRKTSDTQYGAGMNMGEFVHFWSGAAGVNLKSLATTAFGWTAAYETQFVQAQQDFPFTYTAKPVIASLFQDSNYNGYGVYLPVGSYTLADLKAYGARNDDITSLKIAAGYKAVLYWDDNFSGTTRTVTGNVSLLDNGWNDKVSSIVISANTGTIAAMNEDVLKNEDAENAAGVSVYPNPVSKDGTITVNVEKYDATAPVQVTVMDVNKKIVAYKKENASRLTISTGNIAAGFYVVVITNGHKTYTKKVLIQ